MSKTAEAIERARAYIEKTDAEMGSLWTETDNEIAEVLVGFSNRESSSKDARIKELEVQISGKTFFDEKETMAAKIQELEARLETAEKWNDVSEQMPDSQHTVLIAVKGNKIPIRAMWVKEFDLSAEDWEYNGDEDYNEEDDKFYWPEGWYEWNEMEEVHWMCKEVSHWKELPNLPFLTNKTE